MGCLSFKPNFSNSLKSKVWKLNAFLKGNKQIITKKIIWVLEKVCTYPHNIDSVL